MSIHNQSTTVSGFNRGGPRLRQLADGHTIVRAQ